jgi:hypothetical protein
VRAAEIGKAIGDEESLVFAETLDEMRLDLERIARDLDETGDFQTGTRVQSLQQNVEERAIWLLEALRAERERRQQEEKQNQQGEQPDQPQQKNRLVPDEAELKLLRRLDVDVVDQINDLLKTYPELGKGEVDPMILESVQRLAERHERVSKLFSQFRERLNIPPPEK